MRRHKLRQDRIDSSQSATPIQDHFVTVMFLEFKTFTHLTNYFQPRLIKINNGHGRYLFYLRRAKITNFFSTDKAKKNLRITSEAAILHCYVQCKIIFPHLEIFKIETYRREALIHQSMQDLI